MTSISGFGTEYERRVSKAKAAQLLAPYPLPRMGYETDLSVKRDEYGLPRVLTVQNISGQFVVVCCSDPSADWRYIFGIEV